MLPQVATLVLHLFALAGVSANPLHLRAYAQAANDVGGQPSADFFPPPSPTNGANVDSQFPDGSAVGYAGPTPTGAEPAVLATAPAQPRVSGNYPLVNPSTADNASGFNVLRFWGNLSPMFSLPEGTFGINASPVVPQSCILEQVHLLHRHGARYPQATGTTATFASCIRNASLSGSLSFDGSMSFMNTWSYKLGGELLTPFGRAQLFNMGVGFREKYGSLLNNFTEAGALPVFRTTSQDRMLKSALNFAAGFFGIPYEDQYHQSILIESAGFNNSLAPYFACKNYNTPIGSLGDAVVANWTQIYLKDTLARLSTMIHGYNLTINDVYTMQQLCSYETVSLGYSEFCPLFTEEEFRGYKYALNLSYWYSSSFGNPTAAALGIGWTQELLARLTHEHTPVYNTSVNSTLASSDVTNPLRQSIYVDATHDTVISTIVVALNLTSLAAEGPLPTTHRPENQSFHSEQISPFAAQLSLQVLGCGEANSDSQVRVILNDAVVPLTGMKGCQSNSDGFCPLSTFVAALRQRVTEVDFSYDCFADYDYEVPSGVVALGMGGRQTLRELEEILVKYSSQPMAICKMKVPGLCACTYKATYLNLTTEEQDLTKCPAPLGSPFAAIG